MDRTNEDFSVHAGELKQALIVALSAISNHLWNSFNQFSAEIRKMQQAWMKVQKIQELDECPMWTDPLRLPAMLPTLPMKNQVMNRKPLRAVARSSC
jgi:hypothetical protein